MGKFSEIFNELVASFSRFPGVGRRSAERMVFSLLKMKPQEVKDMASKISEIHQDVKSCKLCNNFSTQEVCSICSNLHRNKEMICIVEEPKDIFAIEKTSQYNGLYYVLLGSLSPFDDVGGEDLNIGKLLNRLQEGDIKEVIMATDPDNDGELTAQFLIKKISKYKVKIYRISIGIPLGTQIEYIDSATLGKALMECKPIP
ncbi:MAG: recombination protein RecR [Candidatus Omnitrophota bacterium]|nr:MAG: recombination protein RecR [Candidatus Omnitrophota bacterium]